MPEYNVGGVNVDFPFEAYDCQLAYMEKVIQSLQNKCNALLESPTGTGKTLCLLCATLAWRKSLADFSTCKSERRPHDAGGEHSEDLSSQSESSKLPSIIYTTRTHSQLRQVIQELKRTNYRPKMVVLGSREQLCIHEEVRLLRGRTQTNACHALCRKRRKRYCAHYSRVSDFIKENPGLGDEPIDIEDLINIGRSCGPCPYYVSRELHKVVDILFAPYNYLIDSGNRKSLNIKWDNSILIFDEAHNLEGLCADAASFDLPSGLLTTCISEAKNCKNLSARRREQFNDKSCNPDDFAILGALLLELEKRIAQVPIESKELGFTKPGPYIYELLADLNITNKTATMLINTIEGAALLIEEDTNAVDSRVPQKTKGTICRLESMGDILRIIFRDGGTSHAKYYRVHVQEVDDLSTGKPSRTLSWWCFNPGIAMEEFLRLGVGSIILTSGTLSPMDSFAEELKLEFPVRLENPHVISANQIWSGIVPVGPSGFSFNSSYRSRDSIEYKQELGNTIVNFARIVPDGLLVFFPSYYLLDQCIGCWKKTHTNSTDSTIWERICRHKLPVVEPRQSALFPLAIDDYMAKLKDTSTSGAVFLAVCRGKVSEGLDFADHAGRAVIITGMPFAARTDPKVRLKREYLDQHAQSRQNRCKVLTGEEWYSQQASRAVNQAVGRVIRHRHDYGAIIFCDERFLDSKRQSQISLWIQPHLKSYSRFGDVVFALTRFFRDGGIHGPMKPGSPRTEAQGTVSRIESARSKLHLAKLPNPLTAVTDSTSSLGSLSSIINLKQDKTSGLPRGILPANRSSLTSYVQNQNSALKHSSDMFCNEKKMLISGRKNVKCSNLETVELNKNALIAEEASEELIAPCSLKKCRLLETGQPFQNSHEDSSIVEKAQFNNPFFITDSMKVEVSQISERGSQQATKNGPILLLDSEMTARRGTPVVISEKDKGVFCQPLALDEKKKRGHAFLTQVQEKLTDVEYREFLGFMEGLRSKTMKIGPFLQSIVRLFSATDRLPLLKRFKDHIPTKYQSLYEQYVKTNDDAVRTLP